MVKIIGFLGVLLLPLTSCKTVSSSGIRASAAETGRQYGSKSPYKNPDGETYEAPPEGYSIRQIQLVARHGSRALTSAEHDLVVHTFLTEAKKRNQLHELGDELLKDIETVIKINASEVGYGELSGLGRMEHSSLGQRLYQRQKDFFNATQKNNFIFRHSGILRAKQSGESFVNGLKSGVPGLQVNPGAPMVAGSVDPKQSVQAGGDHIEMGDHFFLYFHALNDSDLADLNLAQNNPSPHPRLSGYQGQLQQSVTKSKEYQNFVKHKSEEGKAWSTAKKAKQKDVLLVPAQTVLKGLVKESYLSNLVFNGPQKCLNINGLVVKLKQKGKSKPGGECVDQSSESLKDPSSALLSVANSLYGVYSIGPALSREMSQANVDLTKYFPEAEANTFTEFSDYEDFYEKGPGKRAGGSQDSPTITYAMGIQLLKDFFDEALADTYSGVFRFAHAETIFPFSSMLGTDRVGEALPDFQSYSYGTHAWRGQNVAPLCANIQWEVYASSQGKAIVKLLYNERDQEFSRRCDSAKVPGTKFYYDLEALRQCYQV